MHDTSKVSVSPSSQSHDQKERLLRYKASRRKLRAQNRPLLEAIRASQRIGRDDLAVRVNLRG